MAVGTATDESRAGAIEAALRALRAGTGVLVVGEKGTGRTRVVAAVRDRLDPDLRERLWVGDDVHRFDAGRAARLDDAIAHRGVLPLMTAAARRPLGALLDRLCNDGAVLRIDLAPLSPGSMLRAVENFLGGPLDPEAAPVIVPARAGGDLVVLQETVRAAQVAGALTEEDGTWSLVRPIPPLGTVRRTVLSRLEALTEVTPSTGPILDLIALAPGIALDRVDELMRRLDGVEVRQQLERLEEDCVIDAEQDDGAVRVRLHDPVIELVQPLTVGLVRRERLGEEIVAVLGAVPASALSAGELLALTRLALAAGRRVPPETLTRAARNALQAYRPELARQLAVAGAADGGGFDALVALVAADSQLGRLDEALTGLTELARRTDLDAGRRALIAQLDGLVRAQLDEPVSRWRLPAGTGVPEGWRSIGELASHPAAHPVDGPPPVDSTAVVEGDRLTAIASVRAMSGDLTGARRALDEAEALLAPVGADLFRVSWARAFVDCYDRPVGETLEVLRWHRDDGAALGNGLHMAMCTYLIGAVLLMSGRAADAAVEVRRAISLYGRAGREMAAVHARPSLASALAVSGDVDGALAELDASLPVEHDPYLHGQILEARGWISVARGEPREAAELFVAAAEAHETDGFTLEALIVLTTAARAGAAGRVLPRVEELAARVEGGGASLFLRFTRALARLEALPSAGTDTEIVADADAVTDVGGLAVELDAIGDLAAAQGFDAVSAEASSRAAELHARIADGRSTASSRRAAEAVARTGMSGLPFVRANAVPVLSRRELEIARLAAAGASNRTIADRLVLSVRTVETHLLRIYRKLGVRGRSDLGPALGEPSAPSGGTGGPTID